jgi:hypothetical protein
LETFLQELDDVQVLQKKIWDAFNQIMVDFYNRERNTTLSFYNRRNISIFDPASEVISLAEWIDRFFKLFNVNQPGKVDVKGLQYLKLIFSRYLNNYLIAMKLSTEDPGFKGSFKSAMLENGNIFWVPRIHENRLFSREIQILRISRNSSHSHTTLDFKLCGLPQKEHQVVLLCQKVKDFFARKYDANYVQQFDLSNHVHALFFTKMIYFCSKFTLQDTAQKNRKIDYSFHYYLGAAIAFFIAIADNDQRALSEFKDKNLDCKSGKFRRMKITATVMIESGFFTATKRGNGYIFESLRQVPDRELLHLFKRISRAYKDDYQGFFDVLELPFSVDEILLSQVKSNLLSLWTLKIKS